MEFGYLVTGIVVAEEPATLDAMSRISCGKMGSAPTPVRCIIMIPVTSCKFYLGSSISVKIPASQKKTFGNEGVVWQAF